MINLHTNKEYQDSKNNISNLNISEQEKKDLLFELWLHYIGNINTFMV